MCLSGDLGVSHSGEGSAAHKTHHRPILDGQMRRNTVLETPSVCAAPLELFLMRAVKSRDRLSHYLRAPLLLARL